MSWLLQGWVLGIAYVAPIGMQNMYVINTALGKSRWRAVQVALITIFFDISLALACFFGVGAVLNQWTLLRMVILGVGTIAVLVVGVLLMRSKPSGDQAVNLEKSLIEVVGACFVVTWLNPQAIIDGTLVLAGFRAVLSSDASLYFIAGVCLASAMWFLGLAVMVSQFKKLFTSKMIQKINVVCGVIIVAFGLKLGYIFVQTIMGLNG